MHRAMLTAAATVLGLGTPHARAQDRQQFPEATPESVGIPRRALELLDSEVRGYTDRSEAVGAELMVIKNRKAVWHAAHGFADRESRKELEPGSILCIRSMTKTFIGTAVQMLIDDGKLAPDDRASKYLPAFDTDTHRQITIGQLLEHRAGLPLSSLIGVDHRTLAGVQDVAALAGRAALESEPGAEFNYSDDGTDTLTAIIEKVSGKRAEEFLEQRILKPLGMRDTVPVIREGDPRNAKMIPAYAGQTGSWTKFWSPGDPPVFPYFLGSQGMYSTCEDYARLLCLWADKGMAGTTRLLSEDAIGRGLTPRSEMGRTSGYDGLSLWYGRLWMLLTEGRATPQPGKVVAFGHGGSDGTLGWIWPDRDLIVLYFTQSRGGMSILKIEQAIDRLLIRADLDEKPSARRNTAGLDGIYWHEEQGQYWAIAPGALGEDRLNIEVEGQAAADLVPSPGGPDEWQFEVRPGVKVRFERAESGRAGAIVVTGGKSGERRLPRLESAVDLPSAVEVAAKVKAAHGLATLRGVVRREGTIKSGGGTGPMVSYLSATAARSDLQLGGVKIRVVRRDGKLWTRRGDAPAEEITGAAAAAAILEQPQFIFGGWLDMGAETSVLTRLPEKDRALLLVRAKLPESYGTTLFIDEATWRVVSQDRIVNVPPFGPIGMIAEFEFFDPVEGVVLPRKTVGTYIVPQLGTTEVKFERIELLEGPFDGFRIDAE